MWPNFARIVAIPQLVARFTKPSKEKKTHLELDPQKGFVESSVEEVTVNKVTDLAEFEKFTAGKKIRPFQWHHHGQDFPLMVSAQIHD
jgi:hypothetical protein